jgi:hypothetical protein
MKKVMEFINKNEFYYLIGLIATDGILLYPNNTILF